MARSRARIAILALPLGGGHAAVARSLAKHLEQQAPGRFDVVVDHLSDHVIIGGAPISARISAVYQWTLEHYGSRPYRWLYDLADRRPSLIATVAYWLFGRQASRWILSQQPDLVISTYPLVASVVGRAVAGTGVKTICVVTDAGRVTRLWWAGRVDLTVAMHQDVVDSAVAFGVDPLKIVDLGLIVDPSIVPRDSTLRDPPSRRGPFTVLLAAGGQGFGPRLLELAALIGRSTSLADVRFIVAAGTNDRWADELGLLLGPRRVTRSQPVGMHELLPTVDLVVGKAGWITLAECFAACRPVVVVDEIPGQEEENAVFAERLRLIRRLRPDQAVLALERYAPAPERLLHDFVYLPDLMHEKVGLELVAAVEGLLGAAGDAAADRDPLLRG